MNPNQLGPQHFLVPGQQREQVFQRYNQPLQSQHNPETSEESSGEEEYERPNIPLVRLQQPVKQLNRKRYLRDNLLIAYSGDRNIEGGESSFSYTINFNESQSGNVKTSAFFNTSLKNIRSISILDVVIPNFYLNVSLLHGLSTSGYYISLTDELTTDNESKLFSRPSENTDNARVMRPPRLQDLPFILLKIEGLDGDMKGTNPELDTATCMLTIDHIRQTTNNSSGCYETLNKNSLDRKLEDNDTLFNTSTDKPELKKVQKGNIGEHILASTDKNILYFKNKTGIQKQFYPNPLAKLGNFKINFFDHLGNLLKFQSDFIEIEKFKCIQPVYNKDFTESKRWVIEVFTKKLYSPEEFRVGDIITFNNIVCSPRNVALESFINQKEGHVLIQHIDRKAASSTEFDNYFYSFRIFTNIVDNLTDTTSGGLSASFIEYATSSSDINVSSGFVFNQSMQHTISFNIKTEEYVYHTEDTELI